MRNNTGSPEPWTSKRPYRNRKNNGPPRGGLAVHQRESTSAPCGVSLHVGHVLHLESGKDDGTDNSKSNISIAIKFVLSIPRRDNGRSRAVADEATGIDKIPDYIILIGPSKVHVSNIRAIDSKRPPRYVDTRKTIGTSTSRIRRASVSVSRLDGSGRHGLLMISSSIDCGRRWFATSKRSRFAQFHKSMRGRRLRISKRPGVALVVRFSP